MRGSFALFRQMRVAGLRQTWRLFFSPQDPRRSSLRQNLPGPQKINFSTVFAGQAAGIKGVHDDIWMVGFTDYDLG